MAHIQATLLAASVTILMVLFCFYTCFRVGALRGKFGVKAPSCSGPPAFERAFRVQMNTLEQIVVTLPLFWIAMLFPLIPPVVVAAIGIMWVVGRILYMQAYMADPDRRGPGMIIGMLCTAALLILAVGGIARVWLLVG